MRIRNLLWAVTLPWLSISTGAAAAEQAKVSIITATVVKQNVEQWVSVEGISQSRERHVLTFKKNGSVEWVAEVVAGDKVKKGQLLARLEQATEQAELKQAQTALAIATDSYNRFKRLFAVNAASKQELEQAESELTRAKAALQQRENALADTQLRAPVSGLLAALHVTAGDYHSASQSAQAPAVIIAPEKIKVQAELSRFLLEQIDKGDTAQLRNHCSVNSTVNADCALNGNVHFVEYTIDPQTRSATAEAYFDHASQYGIRDGQTVSLWLKTQQADNVLAIPKASVIYRQNKPYVFVVKDDQVIQLEVSLGLDGENYFEVKAGLMEGDIIATSGRFQLNDGAHVRVLRADGDTGK